MNQFHLFLEKNIDKKHNLFLNQAILCCYSVMKDSYKKIKHKTIVYQSVTDVVYMYICRAGWGRVWNEYHIISDLALLIVLFLPN